MRSKKRLRALFCWTGDYCLLAEPGYRCWVTRRFGSRCGKDLLVAANPTYSAGVDKPLAICNALLQGETVLAPGLEHHHGNGIGQVQAAAFRAHGQAQALFVGYLREQIGRQAATFRTE